MRRRISSAWRWVIAGAIALSLYLLVHFDPILQATATLAMNPMWLAGFASKVDLPETATPEEILTKGLHLVSSNRGKFEPFEIVRVRQTYIPFSGWYSAAVLTCPAGRLVVLYRRQMTDPDADHPNGQSWWWVKAYESPIMVRDAR